MNNQSTNINQNINASSSQYLDFSLDWTFQEASRISVLLFENNTVRTGHTGYFQR